MHNLLNYLIESSIFLGIETGIYYAFLSRLNTFGFNRFFLLSGFMVSVVIPFISISVSPLSNASADLFAVNDTLEEIAVYPTMAKNSVVSFIYDLSAFQWIYIIGLILLLTRLIIAYYKLNLIGKQNKRKEYKGLRIIEVSNPYHAFSFFKWIFINPSRYSDDEQQHVINHEKAHANYFHTLDIIFLELFLITQWFNPFAWLLKKALKETHEFQADQSVLKSGTSMGRYKALLLAEVSGYKVLAANNFNESLTKKRFNMMSKKNTLKSKVIFPLFAIGTLICSSIVFACNKEADVNQTDLTSDTDDQVENLSTYSVTERITGKIHYMADEMPQYPGGEAALRQFIASEVHYPEEAKQRNLEGKVYVEFVVGEDGNVGNVKIARGVDPILDNEALRVVKNLPQWVPGKINGENVNISYTVPIKFALN
nr:M56 family metallopeptidase [uncultured Carboxylicivirga sp.]